MHSRTAATASITRDQAKVMNYGRIYGAGERFAKTLLMQFNHRLSEAEATQRAREMYAVTKGTSVYQLNYKGRQLAKAVEGRSDPENFLTVAPEELSAMRRAAKKDPSLFTLSQMTNEDLVERKLWAGGTESYMFNKLEEIAQSESPETPVLRGRISRALEPRNVGKEFMTSRVNWVVQSSAVDYLHLMLVSMRYLFDTYK
jgi:DNA polymerase gamma 1